MAQDYVDNVYDSTFEVQTTMANVEKNFAALKSSFSGAGAPSDPIAGMWWFDTTANILKLRNEANNAWQSVWDFANNKPIVTNNVSADFGAALKDPAAATAGLRTLGTGASQALPGNTDLTADASVTPVKLSDSAAGDTVLVVSDLAEDTNSIASWVKIKEIYIPRGGAIRIKYDIKTNGGTAYGRIHRNGAAVGTQQSTTSTSYVTKSEDISGWSSGDLLQLYGYISIPSLICSVANLKLYATNSFEYTVNAV